MLRKGATASEFSDVQLVELIQYKPKILPCIRNDDQYQQFFADVDDKKLEDLLFAAFLVLDPSSRQAKINRRRAALGLPIPDDQDEEAMWRRAAGEEDAQRAADEDDARRVADEVEKNARREAGEEDARRGAACDAEAARLRQKQEEASRPKSIATAKVERQRKQQCANIERTGSFVASLGGKDSGGMAYGTMRDMTGDMMRWVRCLELHRARSLSLSSSSSSRERPRVWGVACAYVAIERGASRPSYIRMGEGGPSGRRSRGSSASERGLNRRSHSH